MTYDFSIHLGDWILSVAIIILWYAFRWLSAIAQNAVLKRKFAKAQRLMQKHITEKEFRQRIAFEEKLTDLLAKKCALVIKKIIDQRNGAGEKSEEK